jgi:hypothetical protein
MATYLLLINQLRPFFPELPYALWGEVNYDSEGDCDRPTDRQWHSFYLKHRTTNATVQIDGSEAEFEVRASESITAARAAAFLLERCGGQSTNADPRPDVGGWTVAEALARTARIREEFIRPELTPFDSHLFWGSWKWVGFYGTEFTWIGRWIMNSVLTGDTRAVYLCIDWLRSGTVHPDQSAALRYALRVLTNRDNPTDTAWIRWYEGRFRKGAGARLYPKPDMQAWLEDLRRGL